MPIEELTGYSNRRYRLLARGVMPAESVIVEHDPTRALQLDAQTHLAIARICEGMRTAGRRVEQNPLLALREWRAQDEYLLLQTDAVDYETYLGLSVLAPNHAQQPVVVTVSAATEVEGMLVIEQRGQLVAQGPGLLHVSPSGHVHPHQTVWQAVVAEAEEELGLLPGELTDSHWIGLARSLTAPCLTVIYRLNPQISWDSLLARNPVDQWEHEKLLALPIDKIIMKAWLIDNFATKAAGPGHATVLLDGWARFGESWFREVWEACLNQ